MASNDTAGRRGQDTIPDDLEIVYVVDGPVSEAARDDAAEMVGRLVEKAPRPVIFARMKLKVDEDRDPDEQAVVQGTLDVSGAVIRAQAAAPTPGEGVTAVGHRLERRMRKLAQRRADAAERPPSTPEGEWRHGDLPSSRPGFYPRPAEDRRIVRRKTFAPGEETSVAEALFDLDLLDYRFFLFTDESDGEVSIVYEAEDEVVLRKLSGERRPADDPPLPIRADTTPAPELTAEEAAERLDVGDADFVFFRDADTAKGSVLYRRYDGHYGLIEPAAGTH